MERLVGFGGSGRWRMKEKKKKKRKKIGGKTRERTSRPSHLTVFCLHFRPPLPSFLLASSNPSLLSCRCFCLLALVACTPPHLPELCPESSFLSATMQRIAIASPSRALSPSAFRDAPERKQQSVSTCFESVFVTLFRELERQLERGREGDLRGYKGRM